MSTTTDRVLAHLDEHGPASRRQIADAIGLDVSKVRNVLNPLRDRRLVEKVGEMQAANCSRPVSVYGLIGAERIAIDTSAIVPAALASRNPLEMVLASVPLDRSQP